YRRFIFLPHPVGSRQGISVLRFEPLKDSYGLCGPPSCGLQIFLTSIMPYKSCCLTSMESTHDSGDRWEELKSNYAQSLAAGVDLPRWAAKSFSPVELAVLGAIRDAAYKAPNGACSLTVSEIAELAEVDLRTAIRAVTMAIAG